MGTIMLVGLGLPISKDRKVLLTQRSAPGHVLWDKKWQIAGGKVEFGETLEEAVEREIWEELRVKAKIIHPYPIVKTKIWYAEESDEEMDTQVVLCNYLLDIGDQVPDLTQDQHRETEDWGWFTLEESRQLDFLPLTADIVEEAFQLLDQHDILNT